MEQATANRKSPEWVVFGKSVRGASHRTTRLPNQDAIGWFCETRGRRASAMVVADGHGSFKCFRSHRGSQIAVESTLAILRELVDGVDDLRDLSAVKRLTEELPINIQRRWQDIVSSDLINDPFTEEEIAGLEEQGGDLARSSVDKNPSLAYGTTLLGALAVNDFQIYLQLGDGDILVVDASGNATKPFPKDERLIANETTSLCQPQAWREVRVRFQPQVGLPPALILAATDGYGNSFPTDEDFLKIGRDYLTMIRRDGVQAVEFGLESILQETSDEGSGDDITLGVIRRFEEADVDSLNRRLAIIEGAIADMVRLKEEAEGKAKDVAEGLHSEWKAAHEASFSEAVSRIEKLETVLSEMASILGRGGEKVD